MPAGQYLNAESGQPFCFDAVAETVTAANGGLPLSNITVGSAPAGVTGFGLKNVNLANGSAYVCGTEGRTPNTTTYSFTVTFTNSTGSVTGTIDLFIYGQCTWTSSTGTVSMFNAAEDLEQNGSQSAFGAPITNGETAGTTSNYPTCTDAQFIGTGLGGAFTVNTANPLPSPTDTNPSAAQGDLASSNLDLGTGGCYGDAVIDISSGEESGSFGTTAKLTWPSPWANGGDCSYGGLGSNSAGGNTDLTNAACPPSQADVNEGYVSCSHHGVDRQRRHPDRRVQQLVHGRLLQRTARSPAVDGHPVDRGGVARRHGECHRRDQLVGDHRRRAQHRALRRRPGRRHVPGLGTRCVHRHLPGDCGSRDEFDRHHRRQLVRLYRC